MTRIGLLAPARDAACGRAVDHGADAVCIGAPEFRARRAAGNPVSEIAALDAYAHRYWQAPLVLTSLARPSAGRVEG
ncbi:MAG: hypothetical protein HY927_01415 [Elusimicrobia bacterium]|nr:hypothetical protein [Elusimicrobiota bacterium]